MSGVGSTPPIRPWMRPLKAAVRAMCGELGSQRALADLLVVSDTLVQQWHSFDVEKAIPWAHALDERIPAAARGAFFRELVGRGVAVVVIPRVAENAARAADLGLAAATVRHASDVAAKLIEAVADGHITRVEGERIVRAVDELVGVLVGIRERAEAAARDGSTAEVVEIRRTA